LARAERQLFASTRAERRLFAFDERQKAASPDSELLDSTQLRYYYLSVPDLAWVRSLDEAAEFEDGVDFTLAPFVPAVAGLAAANEEAAGEDIIDEDIDDGTHKTA